jgi:hypothetical protein
MNALIAAKAAVDAADNQGWSPLCVAVAGGARLEVVRYLVQEAFADPNLRMPSGKTVSEVVSDSAVATVALPGSAAKRRKVRSSACKEVVLGPRKEVVEYIEHAARSSAVTRSGDDRKKYYLVFKDPIDPGRIIPFGTAEYETALATLCRLCPWLPANQWRERPLTKGPKEYREHCSAIASTTASTHS